GRGPRGPAREPAAGNAPYWIAVGHQDRVRAGNSAGALPTEVGRPASATRATDLLGNHAPVELPPATPPARLAAAATAELTARRLGQRKATGRPARAERDGEGRGERGGGCRKDRGERGGSRGHSGGGQRGGFRKDRDDRGFREDRGGFRKDRDDRGGRPGGRKPRWGAQERSDRGARR
ncbi:ATP-dependent RNA helicase, partial [Micrococcus sp. HSID17227]